MNYIKENSKINCYYKNLKKVFRIVNQLIDFLYDYINNEPLTNKPHKIIILHYDNGYSSYHNPHIMTKTKFKKRIQNDIYKLQFNEERQSSHPPLQEFEIKDYEQWMKENNELYIMSQYF